MIVTIIVIIIIISIGDSQELRFRRTPVHLNFRNLGGGDTEPRWKRKSFRFHSKNIFSFSILQMFTRYLN